MKYEVNDFHIHTRYSGCCPDKENTTIRNVIARVDEIGYECIGITDHIFSLRDKETIEKVKAEINEEKKNFRVRVLASAEVDMVPSGEIQIDREFASTLDYVLVAASHFHIIGKENPNHYTPRQAADIFIEYFYRAVESGIADIVAHPFLNLYSALGNLDDIVAEISDDEIVRMLESAKKNRVAVDMNLGLFDERLYHAVATGKIKIEEAQTDKELSIQNTWWHPETQLRFYKLCKEVGVKISSTSDTHTIGGLGMTRLLKPWIEKIGFTEDDFIDYDWIMANRHRSKIS